MRHRPRVAARSKDGWLTIINLRRTRGVVGLFGKFGTQPRVLPSRSGHVDCGEIRGVDQRSPGKMQLQSDSSFSADLCNMAAADEPPAIDSVVAQIFRTWGEMQALKEELKPFHKAARLAVECVGQQQSSSLAQLVGT